VTQVPAGNFTRDGYLILPQVFSAPEIDRFRGLRDSAVREWCFVNGAEARPLVVGDLLERYPEHLLPVVMHPEILGAAEGIMGPFVQLDSVVLHGMQPHAEHHAGLPICWHRDRFGAFPAGIYARPSALICFVYLQEMHDTFGPLRVIPGSHAEQVQLGGGELTRPHPRELLVKTTPGDVVMIHNNLLHSGTYNVTEEERMFLGISYTLSHIGSRLDNFAGPNCQGLLETARRIRDRRLLRLLGQDEKVQERINTGFTAPAERDWQKWFAEDDAHAQSGGEERARVMAMWETRR
jgi:ectoine hydroxylase-related dioxygenase (phytanoyl-CoA dioxygenase family)